ncbi:MAG: portal protein, partial [Firmicutes bacterium]|nr:portal protein [Bacillota bacterium]
MLSLMEDMMLIYRLERSIERRVYKIYVGAIDDADVQAYVEEVANQFKRTPIIDPMTGQVDLRKNLLDVSQDLFIPVRDENAPTPIDTLSAAQNMTALDDIKFVQNKVFTALRIPKTFLNFEENAGDGKNLALLDIRFTRTINRV